MDHEWRYISYQTWRCSIAILIFGGGYSQVQRQVESLIGQSSNRACAPASTAHTLSTLLKHPKSPGVFVQKKTSWRLHKSYTFALKIGFFSDMDTSNHLGAFWNSNRPCNATTQIVLVERPTSLPVFAVQRSFGKTCTRTNPMWYLNRWLASGSKSADAQGKLHRWLRIYHVSTPRLAELNVTICDHFCTCQEIYNTTYYLLSACKVFESFSFKLDSFIIFSF